MLQPRLYDDTFLADVANARRQPDDLHIWWLGQSGFLVQWRGRHLLLDPYLSDSLTRKYAGTDKPHVRMTARVVDPARLDFIDIVTSSHGHTDHLDGETLRPLLAANPELVMVVPEALRTLVAERVDCDPIRPIGMNDGSAVEHAGFNVTAVPAAHEEVERDGQGNLRYLGYVVECGPWTTYHSGDTVEYAGMITLLKQWSIDVALLPINGRSPERRVAGNLDGVETARLAHAIGAGLVIPCHYDMFEFNTASPTRFVDTCAALGQNCRVLQNGERWVGSRKPPIT